MARRTHRNSAVLQDSRHRLDALLEPAKGPVAPIPRQYEDSIEERVKERWNQELEAVWKWGSRLDKTIVRERLEDLVGDLVRNIREGNAGEGTKQVTEKTGA